MFRFVQNMCSPCWQGWGFSQDQTTTLDLTQTPTHKPQAAQTSQSTQKNNHQPLENSCFYTQTPSPIAIIKGD